MSSNYDINLYDVVESAESYFENIDISKKGSGWKKYQRWLYENEPKFYPMVKLCQCFLLMKFQQD